MKKILLVTFCVALALCGCSESESMNDDVIAKISVSTDELPFGPDGGRKEVSVTSSGEWRLSGGADWVTPSLVGGKNGETITFAALPNMTGESKTTVFKVFTGNAVASISVTSDPGYYCSPDAGTLNHVLPAQGGNFRVKLNTNIEELEYGIVEEQDWVKFIGRREVFGVTFLDFSVEPTELYKERLTEIVVSGEGFSVPVSVRQSQVEALFVEVSDYQEYDLAERDLVIEVKSSFDYEVTPDKGSEEWITVKTKSPATDEDGDGLKTSTVTIHLDESVYTRLGSFTFRNNGKPVKTITVKQKDPNSKTAAIDDPELRKYLYNLGWIADNSNPSEISGPGFTSDELDVHSEDMFALNVQKVYGLGAFPALTRVRLDNLNVTTVDLTDCKSIEQLGVYNLYMISEVRTGSNLVSTFDLYVPHIFSSSLTISGENLTEIIVGSTDEMVQYEACQFLDVTGCPKLKTLKAKREPYGGGTVVLKTIYMTQAQSETVKVYKSDQTSIVIKD